MFIQYNIVGLSKFTCSTIVRCVNSFGNERGYIYSVFIQMNEENLPPRTPVYMPKRSWGMLLKISFINN